MRRVWIGIASGFVPLLLFGLPCLVVWLVDGKVTVFRFLVGVALSLLMWARSAHLLANTLEARIVVDEEGFALEAFRVARFFSYRALEEAVVCPDGARLVFANGETVRLLGSHKGAPLDRDPSELCKVLGARKAAFASEEEVHANALFAPRDGESFRATLDGWRNPTYRDHAPEKDEAYAILQARAAPDIQRARAAALLADDAEGKARIRVVAERTKAPIRAALLRIADAEDDVAVAEVVEAWEREHR